MKFRLQLLLLLALAGIAVPMIAGATPAWGPAESASAVYPPPGFTPWPGTAPWSASREGERHDVPYLQELARTAHFIATMQVTTPGPDFGGIREGENLPNIIETDNTSESIWVWSRYYEVTGDDQYHQNILNSFTYSMVNPAYLEESGSDSTAGYYRMYNCGWAVKAEQKYRDVYGDLTYKAYSDSCASYIRDHTLVRSGPNFFPPVLAWAEGNLYLAGLHENNQSWKDRAVQQSRDKIKLWVQQSPTMLGTEGWAMSGGAIMWGLINSYFLAVPDSTAPWVYRYLSYMDNFAPSGQFQNAWNGWYAYGHHAVGQALHDQAQLAIHIALTDTLVAEDGDVDGGIPARHEDGNNADQSWVSAYMYVFGLSEFVGPTSFAQLNQGGRREPVVWLAGGPNPSGGATRVSFDLRQATDLDLSIYDAAGRQVTNLFRGPRAAGRYDAVWDGTNGGGPVASGVYWVSARTAQGRSSQRLVVIR